MKEVKTTTNDMTTGNIALLLIQFALPLLVGNLFQMMYNTVDSLVVGNFVGKEALAAVGSTNMIINILVFFFNGISIGATVVISRYFGAKDFKGLHVAIETTIFITIICGVLTTVVGLAMVQPMLRLQSTPADVMDEAGTYLNIYFTGMLGLTVYNMGSGILRAVGDTKRPLYFLIFTSVVNVLLDLLFVIVFHMGVSGAAFATIISQFLSAGLIMVLLIRTDDVYRFRWKDLCCDQQTLREILRIGLPAGVQSVVTSFSNVVVQSYVDFFGSACMAGWGCFFKLESFLFAATSSIGQAITTFVGQNIGAGKKERVNRGTVTAILMSGVLAVVISACFCILAEAIMGLFTKDAEVIRFGAGFVRLIEGFAVFNAISHTLAGALRGRGVSKAPMIIMLLNFVLLRQLYLYFVTHWIHNSVTSVGIGYPIGWITCFLMESIYYVRWVRNERKSSS